MHLREKAAAREAHAAAKQAHAASHDPLGLANPGAGRIAFYEQLRSCLRSMRSSPLAPPCARWAQADPRPAAPTAHPSSVCAQGPR